MSAPPPDQMRRVVPRWRPFRRTPAGELESTSGVRNRRIGSVDETDEVVRAWSANRSLENAAEVISCALVLGRTKESEAAARQILAPGSRATESLKHLAQTLVSRPDCVSVEPDPLDFDLEHRGDVARNQLRALRRQMGRHPRGSLFLTEAARLYSILGQQRQAEEAMRRALILSPSSRFVLRSAARLFVHHYDPERAYEILRRNEATPHDPWLLAAEIAVGSIAEKVTKFGKAARLLLSQERLSGFQTSELASAMATLELGEGAHRRARQLFRRSMASPTDNAVAQATWAARKLSGLEITDELLNRAPATYEARATRARFRGDWQSVLENCNAWAADEPFSVRPCGLGSYVAATILHDFKACERLAMAGLLANPTDSSLLNNLAVALVNEGRLKEAKEWFARIRLMDADKEFRVTWHATQGLLKFRSGQPDKGRILYRKAVELAKEAGAHEARILAKIHLLREEAILESHSFAELLQETQKEAMEAKSVELNAALLAAIPANKFSRVRDAIVRLLAPRIR